MLNAVHRILSGLSSLRAALIAVAVFAVLIVIVNASEILLDMAVPATRPVVIRMATGCVHGMAGLLLIWIALRKGLSWPSCLILFGACCLFPTIGLYYRNNAFGEFVAGSNSHRQFWSYGSLFWHELRNNGLVLLAILCLARGAGHQIVEKEEAATAVRLSLLQIAVATLIVAAIIAADRQLHDYFATDYQYSSWIPDWTYAESASRTLAVVVFNAFSYAACAWFVLARRWIFLSISVAVSLVLWLVTWQVFMGWDFSDFWNLMHAVTWSGYIASLLLGFAMLRLAGYRIARADA